MATVAQLGLRASSTESQATRPSCVRSRFTRPHRWHSDHREVPYSAIKPGTTVRRHEAVVLRRVETVEDPGSVGEQEELRERYEQSENADEDGKTCR